MDKSEMINKIMLDVKDDKELMEFLLVLANHETSEDNIEERNDLLVFLGTAITLLAYSNLITLRKGKFTKYLTSEITDEQSRITNFKKLNEMISTIVKEEVSEGSFVRMHIFLITALAYLLKQDFIGLNTNNDYNNPY